MHFLCLSSGLNLWYEQTNTLRLEAQNILDRADKFDVLKNTIVTEQDRCEKFIAPKEGDFGSFEYCKKFINWADALSDSP